MNFFSSQQSINLDISDLSLKTAVIDKNGDKFFIKNFIELKLPAGYIQNGVILKLEETSELLLKIIKEAQGGKLKDRMINTVLPETQTFIKLIQIEKKGNQADLTQAILEEIKNHIPYEVGEINFDYKIINQNLFKDSIKNFYQNILIGICPKTIIETYFKLFQKSKLIPRKFEIEALPIVRSCLPADGKEKFFFMFIDLGQSRSSLIITLGNIILFSETTAFSGNSLSFKIKETLNITFEQAEKIKRQKGLNKDLAQGKFFKILDEELKKLTTKINSALEFSRYHFGAEIQKIYLIGGGANLIGLPLYLENSFKIKTEIANPLINIANHKVMKPNQALTFATIIGLGLAM